MRAGKDVCTRVYAGGTASQSELARVFLEPTRVFPGFRYTIILMLRHEIAQLDIGSDPSLASLELQAVFERVWLESIFHHILEFNTKISQEDLQAFLSLNGAYGYEQKSIKKLSQELGITEAVLRRRVSVVSSTIGYVVNLERMQIERWSKQEVQGTQTREPKQQENEESLTLKELNLPYPIRTHLNWCELQTPRDLIEYSYEELREVLLVAGFSPLICYEYLRETVQKTEEFLAKEEWHSYFLRELRRWTKQMRTSAAFQADIKKYESNLAEDSDYQARRRSAVAESLSNRGLGYRLRKFFDYTIDDLHSLKDYELVELLKQVELVIKTLEETGETSFSFVSPKDIQKLRHLLLDLETIADRRD